MWNNQQADSYSQSVPPQLPQPGAAADPFTQIAWSQDQLSRLENEWRRLQRAFAYHPHVTLTPLSGDPPAVYQVDFRLTTVIVNPRTSQLEYVANATVQIFLPPAFPNQSPTVMPVTAIFHPNVSYEGLFLEGLWHPNETLLGLIRKVGDVLAYRSFDPDYAVNPAAMDWLTANQSILPIDQQANLSPQAGGEPLDRICKYGPQSLESIKQSVIATQAAMLGNAAPDQAALRDYAAKTRMALNLFMEKDVPEQLQSLANDLDEAARELLTMAPLYDFVRERRRRVAELRQAVKQLAASKQPLGAELDKFTGLVDAPDPQEPMVALKLIPPTDKLQSLQFSMPRLIEESKKRYAAIQSSLALLDMLAQPALIPTDSMLGQKLDRELSDGESEQRATTREAADLLAGFEPLLKRAGSEATALDIAARWREYLDMADKARQIERRIKEWGGEGLQSYFIENASGRFGPFQLEQSVDLGTGQMFIRNNSGKTIELWDHNRDKPLATNANGVLAVALPAPPPEPGEEIEVDDQGNPIKRTIPTRFSLADRCDDLVVLLDFLRRSAIETVQKFATYSGEAQSWAGKTCRMLSQPEVKVALEEELARTARRWRHMIVDLAALGPWKERLSTYFLLQRASQAVPQLIASINDSKQKHAVSKKNVNEIMNKSGRDVETGSMIVPPRYARQYHEELKLQDQLAASVKVSTAKLKSLVLQLTDRLQNPRRLGKGETPTLRVLPALPAALTSLPLADGQMGHLIVPLEELLQTPLGGPRPEAASDAEGESEYQAVDAQEDGNQEYDQYADQNGEDADPASETAYAGEGYAETGSAAEEVNEAISEDAAEPATSAEWSIHDDDTSQHAEDHEQSDIAFGFDPEPGSSSSGGKAE